MKRELTRKERKFVEGVAQGKSDRQAALEAGYSFSMASNLKAKVWSRPEVLAYFRKLMQSAAIPERVVRKISEHIDAKCISTRVRRRMGPDGNGQRVVLEEVVERTESVDAGVSLRALEMAIFICEYVPRAGEATQGPLTMMQAEGDERVVQKLLGG